jgi:hypothetical protein
VRREVGSLGAGPLRLRWWSFSWAAAAGQGEALLDSTDFDTKRHDGVSPRGETMSQSVSGRVGGLDYDM